MLEDLTKFITPVSVHKENTISRNILSMLQKSKNSSFVKAFCDCVLSSQGDLMDELHDDLIDAMEFSLHIHDIFDSKKLDNLMSGWCGVEGINPVLFLLLTCFFEKNDIKIFALSGYTPHLIKEILFDTYIEDYPFTSKLREFLEKEVITDSSILHDTEDPYNYLDLESNFDGEAAIIGFKLLNPKKQELFEDIMENLLEIPRSSYDWYCIDIWNCHEGTLLDFHDVWNKMDAYLDLISLVRDDLVFDKVASQFEIDTELIVLINNILDSFSSQKEVIF